MVSPRVMASRSLTRVRVLQRLEWLGKLGRYDFGVILFLILLTAFKLPMVDKILFPIWDGAVYLLHARNLLTGMPFFEWFRPPLLPALIAGIWLFTGENIIIIKYVQLLFTVLTGAVFYIILKKDLGSLPAFVGTILFMTSTQILFWSDHILVHGVSLFFAVLTLGIWRTYTPKRWLIGGVVGAIAIFSRYPTGIIIISILLAYILDHKNLLLVYGAVVGLCLPLVPFFFYSPSYLFELVSKLVLEWMTFTTLSSGIGLESELFYIANFWSIFKVGALLCMPTLLLRSAYQQVKHRVWIFWLLGSLITYSLMTNRQVRFTFEWTPAIAYLSLLAILTLKTKIWNRGISRPKFWGFTLLIILLLGYNVTTSVQEYLLLYDETERLEDPALFQITSYIQSQTTHTQVTISDAYAPLLALYSDRLVYENKATNPTELRQFLEQGYGMAWNASLLVSFQNFGYIPPQELDTFSYLQLAEVFELTVGTVHIYHITFG